MVIPLPRFEAKNQEHISNLSNLKFHCSMEIDRYIYFRNGKWPFSLPRFKAKIDGMRACLFNHKFQCSMFRESPERDSTVYCTFTLNRGPWWTYVYWLIMISMAMVSLVTQTIKLSHFSTCYDMYFTFHCSMIFSVVNERGLSLRN